MHSVRIKNVFGNKWETREKSANIMSCQKNNEKPGYQLFTPVFSFVKIHLFKLPACKFRNCCAKRKLRLD